MSQCIIYNNEEGRISTFYPAPKYLASIDGDIDRAARKNVPLGKPFKIVNQLDLPDRSRRKEWRMNDSSMTDGVGEMINV